MKYLLLTLLLIGCANSIEDYPAREAIPSTSEAPLNTNIAHQQLTDNAPHPLQEELFVRVLELPGITTGPSLISVEGARAFFLENADTSKTIVATEFAHLHPPYDGSLHMVLPVELSNLVESKGWGERHPRNPNTVMVYGPRNKEELELVYSLVVESYNYVNS